MSTRLIPDVSRSVFAGILAVACLMLMLLPVAAIAVPVSPLATNAEASEGPTSSAGNWTKKAPATSPSARNRHAMVFDIPTKKIVLFGGSSGGGETWLYDTANDLWTQKTPSGAPSSRNAHAMAYDTKRNVVLMYGGSSGGAETWTYDSTMDMWMNKNPTGAPVARTDSKIVYEPVTDRFLLFGGRTSAGRTNDFYAYDPANNTWTNLPLPMKPSARHRHAMAVDPVARKVVLQGGCIEDNCASQFSDETWHLDPVAGGWTMANPSSNPGQRDDHTLIWDAKNSKMLTCCGYVGGSGYNADVWEYRSSGPMWTQATVGATKPTGRYSYDWAWDSVQGVAVLFGGLTSSGNSAETWVYSEGGAVVPPAVASTLPLDLATNVAVNSNIEITFNTPMDTAATQGAISSNPAITGTFAWSNGDAKVTWNPGTDLTAATQHTITVSTAAKSKAGVAMGAAKVFSFTTATGGGGTIPTVSFSPADSATSVPVNTNIVLTFNVAMDKTVTQSAVTIAPTAANLATWSAGDTVLTLDPTSDLAAATQYTVTLGTGAKSAAGVALPSAVSSKFTTATGTVPTPPKVVSTIPAPAAPNVALNTNVVVNFDLPMDKLATETAFSIDPPAPGAVTWSNADATMTYNPTADLTASTPYSVMVGTGAKSAQGVALPSMHMLDFTTGTTVDSTPPTITHTRVTTVEESTPIPIKATVKDETSLDKVELKYRKSGAPSWTVLPMTSGANDEFTATIPSKDVVKNVTVDYWIEATDKATNSVRHPPSAPPALPAFHSIAVTAKSDGGGGGGGGATVQSGLFGMGSMMDLVIIGVLIAVVIAAVAAAMMMKRKKPGQGVPPGGPYQQGYGPQSGPPQQGQWQPPPQGGQGGWG